MNGADLSKLPPEDLKAEAEAIDQEMRRRKQALQDQIKQLKRSKAGRKPLLRCDSCGKPKQKKGHVCK